MFIRLQWFFSTSSSFTYWPQIFLPTNHVPLMKEAGPLDMSGSGKEFQMHELQTPFWLVSQRPCPDLKRSAEPGPCETAERGMANSKRQKCFGG